MGGVPLTCACPELNNTTVVLVKPLMDLVSIAVKMPSLVINTIDRWSPYSTLNDKQILEDVV